MSWRVLPSFPCVPTLPRDVPYCAVPYGEKGCLRLCMSPVFATFAHIRYATTGGEDASRDA